MYPPAINPTPKQRFQESPDNISKHKALLENRELQRAIDFSLAEYSAQLALTVSENPNLATVAGLKSTGVHEFLMTFKMLATNPPKPVHTPSQNLDHKV